MFNIYWFIKYGRTQFSMHTRTRAIVGDTAGIWDHLRPDHTTTNCDPMESPCDPTQQPKDAHSLLMILGTRPIH